jgi:REP element-mobilizing transposase RayT
MRISAIVSAMKPTPIYEPNKYSATCALKFSWAGFPSASEKFPPRPPEGLLVELAERWESDGMRLLEHRWSEERIQLTFSTEPVVSPEFLASRAKGRLQHALRGVGAAVKFSRKLSVRSIGENKRSVVERYVKTQLERADLADPKYRQHLQECAWADPDLDLTRPVVTASGRYWYAVHLVLVVADRFRIGAESTAPRISETCRAAARKHGWGMAALSVMPDHLHALIRGTPADSPEAIALSFQNNTAWKQGRNRIWSGEYYVGTVGEYTVGALRKNERKG